MISSDEGNLEAKKKGPRNVAVPEALSVVSQLREFSLPRITVQSLVRDERQFGEQIFFA